MSLSSLGAMGRSALQTASAVGADPSPALHGMPQSHAVALSTPSRLVSNVVAQPSALPPAAAPGGAVPSSFDTATLNRPVQQNEPTTALAFANGDAAQGGFTTGAAPGDMPATPGQWSAYAKHMLNGMNDEFAQIMQIGTTPLAAPNFPGGEAMVQAMNGALHFQQVAIEFQVSMSAADKMESTVKATSDKLTEMKD